MCSLMVPQEIFVWILLVGLTAIHNARLLGPAMSGITSHALQTMFGLPDGRAKPQRTNFLVRASSRNCMMFTDISKKLNRIGRGVSSLMSCGYFTKSGQC